MLPSVTAKEMQEVDRLMVEEWGIGLLQMMEHAGRNLAEVARSLLGDELASRPLFSAEPRKGRIRACGISTWRFLTFA